MKRMPWVPIGARIGAAQALLSCVRDLLADQVAVVAYEHAQPCPRLDILVEGGRAIASLANLYADLEARLEAHAYAISMGEE